MSILCVCVFLTQILIPKALKETHEALHREVETLKAENQRLRRGVDDLSDTVKR